MHHLGLCETLPPASAAALARISRSRRVPAGTVISREGNACREVHNVVSGLVRLSKLLPDGREQIVGLLQPTDFLGRPFADACPFTATAVRETELCSIERTAFETLLQTDPALEHAVLREVLTELDAARDWMVVLGTKSGRERVASFLLLVIGRAERHGCRQLVAVGGPGGIDRAGPVYEIPLTRVDIGQYLGLSLETVSRQVSRLAAEGVIDLVDPRRFRVRDIDRLRSLSATSEAEAG